MRQPQRPSGIAALAIFFGLGAGISLLSLLSLARPGSVLEPMWRIRPQAREAFERMHGGAFPLLASVSILCGCASVGLWNGRRWGYRMAIGLLVVDMAGNLGSAAFGAEPRALVGLPIAAAILVYLGGRRAREFFGLSRGEETAGRSG